MNRSQVAGPSLDSGPWKFPKGLTREQAGKIIQLRSRGLGVRAIAWVMGTNRRYVQRILLLQRATISTNDNFRERNG